jgi:hypothetical protein
MAGAFPTLAHGQTTQSGLVHKLEIRADIQQFRSGAEQRYAISGLLNAFTIGLSNLRWSEVQDIRDFFILQLGAFDSLWSITLTDPATGISRPYLNMALDSDELSVSETKPARYSVSFDAVQTVGETVSVSLQPMFPLLATGAKWQLPSSSVLKFKTDRNDLEAGKRISYYVWPGPAHKWTLDFSLITDAELATYVSHYLGQGGPVNPFSFADPDTLETYEGCRYALGGIEITRRSRDANRLRLTIEGPPGPPLPEAEPMSANLGFSLTTSCPDPATWATLWGPDALSWGAGSGGTSASVNLSVSPSGLRAFVLNLAFGHSEFWWAPGFLETGSLAEAAHATVSGIHLECTYADGSVRIKRPRHSSSSSAGAWGTASASRTGATFAIWHTSGLSNMVGAQFRDFA